MDDGFTVHGSHRTKLFPSGASPVSDFVQLLYFGTDGVNMSPKEEVRNVPRRESHSYENLFWLERGVFLMNFLRRCSHTTGTPATSEASVMDDWTVSLRIPGVKFSVALLPQIRAFPVRFRQRTTNGTMTQKRRGTVLTTLEHNTY